MKTVDLIANQLKELYTGRNWTWSCITDQIEDITLDEAGQVIYGLNSIQVLLFHLNYYVKGVHEYLDTGELKISDKYAFTPPKHNDEESWKRFKKTVIADGLAFADRISKLDDGVLPTIMIEDKYGTYFRNLQGIIEHAHYHLGQIVIIKKILRAG